MSVKQVLEVICDGRPILQQYEQGTMLELRDVRSVLGNLVALGYVSLQKKNVHMFALRGE